MSSSTLLKKYISTNQTMRHNTTHSDTETLKISYFKMVQPLWKTVLQFLRNLKIELLYMN